jgi:hypothetical protein
LCASTAARSLAASKRTPLHAEEFQHYTALSPRDYRYILWPGCGRPYVSKIRRCNGVTPSLSNVSVGHHAAPFQIRPTRAPRCKTRWRISTDERSGQPSSTPELTLMLSSERVIIDHRAVTGARPLTAPVAAARCPARRYRRGSRRRWCQGRRPAPATLTATCHTR